MDYGYGLFDMKYIGAKINCTKELRYEAFRKYLGDMEKESFFVNLDDCEDEKEREDSVNYSSCYFHESRHVHDFLTYPYLNYLYRLRILSMYNTVASLFSIPKTKINTLPIPLVAWIRKSEKEKQTLIERWKKRALSKTDVLAPSIYVLENEELHLSALFQDMKKGLYTNDDFIDSLFVGAAYYDAYKSEMKRYYCYNTKYSVEGLLETSAFVHQVFAIAAIYGDDEANRMARKWFSDSFQKNYYNCYTAVPTTVHLYITKCAPQLLEVEYPFLSYLMCWCFSGNMFSNDEYCHPHFRFCQFLNNDLGKAITLRNLTDDPFDVFSYWNKKLNLSDLDYMTFVESNEKTYEGLLERKKMIDNEWVDKILNYYRMLLDASFVMLKKFTESPSDFLHPQEYIKKFYNYVNVPILFQFGKKKHLDFIDYPILKYFSGLQGNTDGYIDTQNFAIDKPFVNPFPVRQYIGFYQNENDILIRSETSNEVSLLFDVNDMLFSKNISLFQEPENALSELFNGMRIKFI